MKRDVEAFKREAALHGAKIDEASSESNHHKTAPNDLMMFGHPNDYKKLSKEERKELTNKMKAKHKAWAKQTEVSSTRIRSI